MERIYNFFLFFENDLCSSVGFVTHNHTGSDDESVEFLRKQVSDDLQMAKRAKLTKAFSRSEYNARCRLGEGHHLFHEAFSEAGANANPLFVSTPIMDGVIFFNYFSDHSALDINDVAAQLGTKSQMVDWLVKYTSENGINLSQLIHDDYFLAIKLTFNARLYVSSMKLLVSCIDSIAYIEYGNERDIFVRWLDAYADLTPLGITAVELWELRNGLLHMTNLNARKVGQNKVRRITFRVGGPPDYPREGLDGIYYFDFHGLIQSFGNALVRWLETYNSDRDKFAKFVERYDETISDNRVAITHLAQAASSLDI